jgi:preprotein translocase subunit SecY
MQLMTAVIPKLEELSEQGEQGQQKIQQYTRYLTFPLALLQGIGMVYFINYLFGGAIINTGSVSIVLLTAFSLAIGAMIVMWLGELITERGITNGISLLIFASIVAGMSSQISTAFASASNPVGVFIFMAIFILVLIVLSILILRSVKEIPIVYSRQGKVQETSVLPLPMNPVGMIPIIFALAFASFPYLLSQLFLRLGTQNETVLNFSSTIELYFNIYSQQPGRYAIIIYFILIVAFTFFYAMIQFNPERMAHNIQQRGGFVPGIRPGDETAKYIGKTLNHLCLRGGSGLALLGVLNFIIVEIPFIRQLTFDLGSLPLVVTGSGIIIIVGVVQDLVSKIDTEIVMTRYDVKL